MLKLIRALIAGLFVLAVVWPSWADAPMPGERLRPRQWYTGSCTFVPLKRNLNCPNSLSVNSQGSTYALAVGDTGKVIKFTGATDSTWTVPAATTVGASWWGYLQNAGTASADIVLVRSGADTIDGLTTYYMYPGEVRLITSDGVSAFNTIIVSPFSKTYATTTANEILPPGYEQFVVDIWGGGGSGGVRTTTGGASGGGGGAHNRAMFPVALLSTTWTATVGAGGASVASSNASGNPGGQTTFTSGAKTLTTFGGGAGFHGLAASDGSGGGGGGTGGVGGAGATGSSAGGIASVATSGGFTGTFAGGAGTTGAAGVASGDGGGGGGGFANASSGQDGGASFVGGGGGAGTNSATTTARNGGASLLAGVGCTTDTNGAAITAATAPGGGGCGARNGNASGAGATGWVVVTGIVK